MYNGRKLSDLELDAIDVYKYFPNKSVEHIARDLKCPVFYVNNIIFKYINGYVKGKRLLKDRIHQKPIVQPRRFIELTPQASKLSYEELVSSGIKLRTMLIKDK